MLAFTIVTIVFSPLSFVAAFFTMNLTIFPGELSLSCFSRYVFGFGLAIAIQITVLAISLGWCSSSWVHATGALYEADLESTVDHDALKKKGESPNFPGQSGPTQEVGRLSHTPFTILQNDQGHPSPSLRDVRNHETPDMTTRLKRRWRNWRNPKTADLPW